MNTSLLLRFLLIVCFFSLNGCKFNNGTTEQDTTVLSQVIINDYIVVSTRRVSNTITEYTLRAVATNTSSNSYTNVTASLISVPSHITIVDGVVTFSTVLGSDDTTSADEFIVQVDLSQNTSITGLEWQVKGVVSGTGGGEDSGPPKQVGIFMNIGDGAILGESTSDSHKNWIELLSFTEGSSIDAGSTTGGGSLAGKVNLEGVTASKYIDTSSPKLRLALSEGDLYTNIKIDIVKSCGTSIYTEYAITLSVSSLTELMMTADSEAATPTENLSLNYSRIETMYTPVGPDCRLEIPVYSYQDAIRIE